MEPYTGVTYYSHESCWRCGTRLWRLEPAVQGHWRFDCPACRHRTVTRVEANQALQALPDGAVGVVVTVPYALRLEPAAPPIDSRGV